MAPDRAWWSPPHYWPTIEERRRAFGRMLKHRAETDESVQHLPEKDREAAIGAIGAVADPWPEFADPSDLKRLGFSE